ncbi:MAG: glycosyltransferase [Pseudomonadota bacterium]
MRVMIVVTHLLGTGHLSRALTLARAFVAAGDAVTVVSGGRPVPHFDTGGVTLVQLPPVASNGADFTTLLDDSGAPASAAYMQARTDALIGALDQGQPDVLITELFPFGRRILRQEFGALLTAARALRPAPLVLSSIRDILAPPSKPSKAAFAEATVRDLYDSVLVHSDPAVVPLDRSWPVSDTLARALHYTGFVAPPVVAPAPAHGAVIVSAGGGTVGDGIFDAALAAARQDMRTWRLLIGGDAARRARFAAAAPDNVVVEPPTPDFRTLLTGAAASVSMCGYNTALDVLQTGVPAVLIPFDDGGEVEQGLRADALAALPGIAVLRQDGLTGDALLDAVKSARMSGPRLARTDGMDGAGETARIVHRLVRGGSQ